MFLRSLYSTSKIWLGLILLPWIAGAAEFGIAAKYAKDQNLLYDPDVLLFWDYEDGENFRYGWQSGISYYQRTNNPADVFLGNYSIRADLYAGTMGYPADVHLLAKPETCLYQRWYRKLEPGFQLTLNGLKNHGFGGYGPGHSATEIYRTRPDGTNTFWAIVDPTPDEQGNMRTAVYYYHPDQAGGYGDLNRFGPIIQTGVWYCIEMMVKMNTIGQRDGELKVWVNGNLEFSRTNMRWRTISPLAINVVSDLVYNGIPKNQAIWFDNRAIARKYIGPASGAGPNAPPIPTTILPVPRDTIMPSVTGLFPVANATEVSAKTLIQFHLKDDRDVDSTTIVLKVNGQAVKPKITGFQRDLTVTYPNQIGYPSGSVVSIVVNAKDVSGNSMPTYNYSFTIAGTPRIAMRPVPNPVTNSQMSEFDPLGRECLVRNGGRPANANGVYLVKDRSKALRLITAK